jgi:hypothetical protein
MKFNLPARGNRKLEAVVTQPENHMLKKFEL